MEVREGNQHGVQCRGEGDGGRLSSGVGKQDEGDSSDTLHTFLAKDHFLLTL